MAFHRIYKLMETWMFVFFLLTGSSLQCGHGIRGGGGRFRPQKITPLVFKQHVPNVSENTLGASGLSEGKISRDSPKFKDLVEMFDTNIIFRDEEGNGSDRIMSKRCKDKLKSLSIAVMNQWPNVKLRVVEAWDEDLTHSEDSLHYEGRAVDITTSDRDRTKYPMLARLAVEAGFDYVYYESKGHIHCSVKSDSSAAIKTGGCFPGDAKVKTENGFTKNMSSLQVGEKVLTVDSNGKLTYSDVIMFMDRDIQSEVVYYSLSMENEKQLTLTPDHLVYVSAQKSDGTVGDLSEAQEDFASNVKIGNYVYFADQNGLVKPSRVIDVHTVSKTGVYAPLTRQGTIVVNEVIASCYAVINNHSLAHAVFAPVRLIQRMKDWLGWCTKSLGTNKSHQGIHWYPKLFQKLSPYVLNKNMFHGKL